MTTTASTAREGPVPVLLQWLHERGIEHEVREHRETFTARETARAEGVEPSTFAKVVGVVTDDGRCVLIVLDATDHVDLHKARRVLAAEDVRILTEGELTELAPDCAAGAIPAVGLLYDIPMVADYAVRDDPDISFNAGSHRFSVRVDRSAWELATGVEYADIARDDDTRPAWALS
jgi:Ala-tRNA(Pro) deacylase